MTDMDVLLIEDNHGDVALVERAFEDRDLPGTLTVVQTGDEALDRLRERAASPDASPPDLVLLDLNLPATSGHEVLAEIKSDPQLKRIPVTVLTSSQSDDDLLRAYDRGASACLIKPVDPDEFADRIEAFATFWAETATLLSDVRSDR